MSIIAARNAMFLPDTVFRSHPVLHNQNLMESIGGHLMLIMKDRGTFIRVCRVWRHVFYTRLIDSPFQTSVKAAILGKLCLDACLLFTQYVSTTITMDDIDTILKGSCDARAISKLVWALPRDGLSTRVRYFYNIIASPKDVRMDRLVDYGQTRLVDFATFVVRVDGVPPKNLARFCGLLKQAGMLFLFIEVLPKYPSRIHVLLPYMTIDIYEFALYMHEFSNRQELWPTFDAVCRAFARDVYVDHYVGCLNRISTHPEIGNWFEKYLHIGAGLGCFATELFKAESYLAAENINQFILMGYIDPCSKTKYKFEHIKASKMTIFEYASFIGNQQLCDYIFNDSRFRAHNHLDILTFVCVHNRYGLAMKFLNDCNLDKKELQAALKLMVNAKKVSRKQDTSHFDLVIKRIEERVAEDAPRKRIKLTNKLE